MYSLSWKVNGEAESSGPLIMLELLSYSLPIWRIYSLSAINLLMSIQEDTILKTPKV